jgi:hypothetical protein
MLSIATALERIKGRVTDALPDELIEELCRQVGHRWRNRDLGPVVTTHLFVRQILEGNVASGELRRRCGLSFTDSAYCQARTRLPRAVLERLQRAVTQAVDALTEVRPGELWHGHRVFLLDGSSFSMPDTPPLQAYFGQPAAQATGCGFPVAHLLVRCDAWRGYLLETQALPLDSHDRAGVPALHAALEPGDVLVGDRAFASYAHLALCQQRGVQGVFRAHQKQIIDFRPWRRMARPGEKGKPHSRWIKRLGRHDQWVEYYKPKDCNRPSWMSMEQYAQLPAAIIVREVRYTVSVPGRRTRVVTLVTTLLDGRRYAAAELARLYGLRWQVETDLRHLKETLGLAVLRCTTVEGVLKELTLFVLIYNLVRRVMCEAAQRQDVPPHRISFIDAWRWLRNAGPGDELPELVVNPARPGRCEPRVRKRRPKQYSLMRRPRDVLRKELHAKKRAA